MENLRIITGLAVGIALGIAALTTAGVISPEYSTFAPAAVAIGGLIFGVSAPPWPAAAPAATAWWRTPCSATRAGSPWPSSPWASALGTPARTSRKTAPAGWAITVTKDEQAQRN